MKNNERILISGSTGFVGKNLLNCLKSDIDFQVINRGDLQSSQLNKIIEETDILIHLAGKAHDLKNITNAEEYYDVNYQITKQIYDAFIHSAATKFIFLSSVKAAADSASIALTEDVKPNPQTHYGKSKLLAEQYIQNQPLIEGKSYYILRPCMIHGPGNKGNLNLLYKFVKKGIPYPLAGFDNRRSFLSIDNLCFIINEIISRDDIPGGIYHLSDNETLSTNDVVSILASSLNLKPRLWKIPKNLIRFLAKAGDLLHLPLTTERLNKLTESYVVSNQKIKNALKKELPLTAVEGLKITANSFKNI
jgi:nucleoside-diphosphate-sugar epimerase